MRAHAHTPSKVFRNRPLKLGFLINAHLGTCLIFRSATHPATRHHEIIFSHCELSWIQIADLGKKRGTFFLGHISE